MVRLEHVMSFGDWFALDNVGTSIEGTYDEWLAILSAMEELRTCSFKRVSVEFKDDRFLFASPRNSIRPFDATLEHAEAPAFLAQARGVLREWWEAEHPPVEVSAPAAVLEPSKPKEEPVPRIRTMDDWTLAEHLCRMAMLAVESMGADEHLTRAVSHLGKAKDAIDDFIEKRPTPSISGFVEGAPIDLRTLQRLNAHRVAAFKMELTHWSPMEWGCELGEETGEFLGSVLALGAKLGDVLGAVKKRGRPAHPTLSGCDITGKPVLELAAVGAELADLVIVTALLASRLGLDLNNAVRAKWNATSEKVGWKERL